jgi:transposase
MLNDLQCGYPIKILWHDGIGMSRYAKRVERGRFIWPALADGTPREPVVIPATACPYCGGGWSNSVTPETLEGRAAAGEDEQDRARKVNLPRLRKDYSAAGAVRCHPTRPCRAKLVGDDPLCQVRRASAAEPALLEIYAREGVDLDVSTLADHVGAAAAVLSPLSD